MKFSSSVARRSVCSGSPSEARVTNSPSITPKRRSTFRSPDDGEPVDLGRDVTAAAHLGADDDLALAARLLDEQAAAGRCRRRRSTSPRSRRTSRRPSAGAAPGRPPRASPTRAGRATCGRPSGCRRRCSERGNSSRREEVGELLVLRPGRRARERAVHVGARRPAAREGERRLGRDARHDDHAARDLLRPQVAREVDRGDLALGLVAVDAAEHDRRRPVAVRDDDDRDRAGLPSRSCSTSAGSRAGRTACQAHRGRPCSEPGSHSSEQAQPSGLLTISL